MSDEINDENKPNEWKPSWQPTPPTSNPNTLMSQTYSMPEGFELPPLPKTTKENSSSIPSMQNNYENAPSYPAAPIVPQVPYPQPQDFNQNLPTQQLQEVLDKAVKTRVSVASPGSINDHESKAKDISTDKEKTKRMAKIGIALPGITPGFNIKQHTGTLIKEVKTSPAGEVPKNNNPTPSNGQKHG